VSLAVYAIGRAAMHEWAASALGACPVVVDDPGLEAQPAGTHWLCVADDLETLRARRPDDDYTVVEPTPAVAWSSLAHDVRGPIGVVRGALAELASEDPMIPLAQRAVGRLVHLTECWDALEAAPERSEVDVAELLAEATRSSRASSRAARRRWCSSRRPRRWSPTRRACGWAWCACSLT